MNKTKIDVNDYVEFGLGDIYYDLISFIGRYVNDNYDAVEMLRTDNYEYAIAVDTMKSALKELLDYFKTHDDIYLPALDRKIKISTLNVKEQAALEERCKEYLIAKLNATLGKYSGNKRAHR